jgi:hypothetical protein
MRPRSLAASATAVALASAATAGGAEAGRPSLRVECPALGDEARAVLEARAQAELVSERLPDGEVTVTCEATSASVAWVPRGGPRRVRTLELAGDGASIDDRILVALHALLFEETGPPPVDEPDVREAAPAQEGSPARRFPIAGVAGGDTELWHGGVSVALGAYTGLLVSPWNRWTFVVVVAPQWGLGNASGTSAWGLRAVARVDYEVVPHVELGLGVSGRSLWVGATGAAQSQLEGTTAGAIVAARYVVGLGPIELSVGPHLEALVRPIVVDVGGSEVFRVPSFVGALTVDGAAP